VRLANLRGTPAPPPVEKTVKGIKRVVPAPPPAPVVQPYTVETIRGAKRTTEEVKK
jgi:hypothetical protein